MGSECPSYGERRCTHHQVCRTFSGCLVTTDYLNPRRVGIYAHAVQQTGFRQPETGLADKNTWATSAHPTANSVARIIRHTRAFSGCLVTTDYLNPRRVGIYAHAVQSVGFRQPETGLADKTRGQQAPTLRRTALHASTAMPERFQAALAQQII